MVFFAGYSPVYHCDYEGQFAIKLAAILNNHQA
jgi:hypothetical protein